MPCTFFLRISFSCINDSKIRIPYHNKEWSKTRQHVKATTKQSEIPFKQLYPFPLITNESKLGTLSEPVLWKEQSEYLQCLYLVATSVGNLDLMYLLTVSCLGPSEMLLGTLPCLHFDLCHILQMALDACVRAAEQKPLMRTHCVYSKFFLLHSSLESSVYTN